MRRLTEHSRDGSRREEVHLPWIRKPTIRRMYVNVGIAADLGRSSRARARPSARGRADERARQIRQVAVVRRASHEHAEFSGAQGNPQACLQRQPQSPHPPWRGKHWYLFAGEASSP
jgi:hypothetical protein